MANKGWKHKKTPIIIGNEKNPTKMESGQVIINKKATKKNLNKLININNDGLNKEKSKVSTDGTDGGILKGKPHYDSKGKSLGGIPVIVDGGKKIEVEGEEFVINKEASQKHWKELSKINQSAGNGVPINPSDVGSDDDPQEFRKGGTAKIIFNPNHIPNKWIYSYAKKVKEEYPKVWDIGGNIFGNEAFKNLERVIKRGYWTDNEEWMYIKWQSYVARHHKDFRIAGTVAMLKWVDKTDKGWDYMKALIDKEVAKKYPKKGFKRKLLGGNIKSDCIEFIKKTESIRSNGHYLHIKNLNVYVGAGDKTIPKIKSLILITYNSGGQLNLKVTATINSLELAKEIAKLLNIEIAIARIIVSEQIKHSKRFSMDILKKFENENIIIANRDKIECTNIISNFKKGSSIKDITCKSCNWSWNKSDSEKHDEYVCHKCGADNKMENAEDFMRWYIDWNKTINKKINISFLLPNKIQPFKESNVVILDLFEKIDQKIDAKQYLNKIIENADKYGVVIYLEPIPRYKYFLKNIEKRKKISKDYLISYYQKFGFQLTTNGRFMKRLPKPITDNKMKDGGEIKNDFKYSKDFAGITIYTNKEQEYVGQNYSLFENKGSFKATIRKGDLENIAIDSIELKDFNFQWGVDDWKLIAQKLKNKGINKLELYAIGVGVKTYELRPLFNMKYGGELAKGIKVEAEHQNTFKKVYAHELNPKQAPIEIAKEHLKEDKNYYSKLSNMEKFDTGGAANAFEIGDIIRGEYFGGIYGNFRVVNPGADAVEVQNLLTGHKVVRQYKEFSLILKKGTNQVQATSTQTTTKQPNIKNDFKFNILDDVIYKSNGETAKVTGRRSNITGNKLYIIEFSGGDDISSVKETDLEEIVTLERGQPAMPMPNAATVIKDELPKERKKFVEMDFKPFLEQWVSSNLTNMVNMDKKNIIEETVKDYIINVEAIDKNQNITFTKEAEILDKIDNYIN